MAVAGGVRSTPRAHPHRPGKTPSETRVGWNRSLHGGLIRARRAPAPSRIRPPGRPTDSDPSSALLPAVFREPAMKITQHNKHLI
jgi:hypothetical protein